MNIATETKLNRKVAGKKRGEIIDARQMKILFVLCENSCQS